MPRRAPRVSESLRLVPQILEWELLDLGGSSPALPCPAHTSGSLSRARCSLPAGLGLKASDGQLGEAWALRALGLPTPRSQELQSQGQSSTGPSRPKAGQTGSLKSSASSRGPTGEEHRQVRGTQCPSLDGSPQGGRCDLLALSLHSCPSLEVVSVRKGGRCAICAQASTRPSLLQT